MALEIEVSRARCIASKACVNAAGRVFAIVDGASMVVDPSGAADDVIVAAAEACPTRAITVRRDGAKVV